MNYRIILKPPGRARRLVRWLAAGTIAAILLALAWLGHMIALIAGALDALLAALLGLPRTRALGAIVAVMRDSWKDNR